MKKIFVMGASTLFLFACNNGDATKATNADTVQKATEKKFDAPPDSAAMAAMQQAWIDFATPGDMHKWMAKHVGTWEGEVQQFMDPAAPPTTAKATTVTKLAMNGLYLMDDYSSTMMGQPMQGHSIMGYDKVKKKFVMSWVDNLGSGIVQMEGTYDEASKTLNMIGTQSDPGKGGSTSIRQEQKWMDDNTYMLTMYGTGHDGKTEQKFMEGTFKKVK